MQQNDPKTGALLLVEDNKGDQQLLKHAFLTLNISNPIIIAENGEEALNYLNEEGVQPVLILCDINMPRMDGLQLRERIYNNYHLRKKSIPFIFMSSGVSMREI